MPGFRSPAEAIASPPRKTEEDSSSLRRQWKGEASSTCPRQAVTVEAELLYSNASLAGQKMFIHPSRHFHFFFCLEETILVKPPHAFAVPSHNLLTFDLQTYTPCLESGQVVYWYTYTKISIQTWNSRPTYKLSCINRTVQPGALGSSMCSVDTACQ